MRKRVALTSELQAGIAAGELFLMYQPQVDMETSQLVGLEALVRWKHPTRGVLLPGEFLPVAERSGLIVMLGNWVLRSACRQAGNGGRRGRAPSGGGQCFGAAVQGAARAGKRDRGGTRRRPDYPPATLEIEMTETALMGTSSGHDNVIERLRARGLRIAIDDFGTGYSSLLYLRRFPVDRIKIAQEFVKDIGIEPNDTAIVKAAIGLARELGIGVIAEGVETADQVRLLHAWGCRQAQGFYFAAPMTAEDVLPLLRSRQRHALARRPFGRPPPVRACRAGRATGPRFAAVKRGDDAHQQRLSETKPTRLPLRRVICSIPHCVLIPAPPDIKCWHTAAFPDRLFSLLLMAASLEAAERTMALLPEKLSTLICATCGHAMDLVRTIPRFGVLPKLFVFQCPSCHDVAAK